MNLRYFCLVVFCFLFAFRGFAQDSTAQKKAEGNLVVWPILGISKIIDSVGRKNPEIYWSSQNRFGVDISEVAFSNWSAGGSNSVSFLFNTDIKRTYEHNELRWQNELIARYGINAQKGRKLRKTDDHIEFVSTLGYRADSLSSWFYSAKMNFKTQFSNGYSYPNRDEYISRFMAPGYMFIGFGAEYGRDSDKFTLYISPATEKTTFVLSQRLANKGAFGVQKAIYDASGNIIKEGKRSKSEFGILITNSYNAEVLKNIRIENRISLYTDYLHDFGNIDIDWSLNFSFKVNDFVAAKIGSHLLYDNDTKNMYTNAAGQEVQGGAKVQWKQQLGIGVLLSI